MSNGDKPPAVIVTVTATDNKSIVLQERVYVVPCGKASSLNVALDVDKTLTELIHSYEDKAKT